MSSKRGVEYLFSYFPENLQKTWLLFLFFLLCTGVVGAASVGESEDTTEQSPTQEIWNVGDIVYAKISRAPEFISTSADFSDASKYIENRWLYGESPRVSERHEYLDVGQVVRVEIVSDTVARILPEYGRINPTTYDVSLPVFIPLELLRPLPTELSEPISVFPETKQYDKLIVIIHDSVSPYLLALEGGVVVLKVPVVLGPTPYGDFRIWRKRVSDDMPGIPAIGNSQCFSGGYCIHGSPWWNWSETNEGHYGSHGCVNLPDDEWYTITVDGEEYSIDEWLFRWTNSGMPFDTQDPTIEEVAIQSTEDGWYVPTRSTRVIVVNSLEELYQFPITARLDSSVADAQVTDWQQVIVAATTVSTNWVIPDQAEGNTEVVLATPAASISPAELRGTAETETPWVMLDCQDASGYSLPAAPGASRTVGELCTHFVTERPGSICTPERVDEAFFGQRIYCVAERFDQASIDLLGELTQHELIHLAQFKSPKLLELLHAGVAVDDVSVGQVDFSKPSLGAWLEFGAQAENMDTTLDNFYRFVLVSVAADGSSTVVNSRATTAQTWEYLHHACGDSTGADPQVHELIRLASLMDGPAYEQFQELCGAAPHQLVPDYSRN